MLVHPVSPLRVLRGSRLEFLGWTPVSVKLRVPPRQSRGNSHFIRGNVAALQALYSSNPPAQVATAAGASTASSEVAFWTGLKVRRLKLNVIQSESPQPGVQQLVFQAEIHTRAC